MSVCECVRVGVYRCLCMYVYEHVVSMYVAVLLCMHAYAEKVKAGDDVNNHTEQHNSLNTRMLRIGIDNEGRKREGVWH